MSNGNGGTPKSITWRGFTAVLGPLTAIQIALVGWFATTLKEQQKEIFQCQLRVTTIESNRFTAKDGHALMELIFQKLPPKWLVQRLEMMEKKIEKLERKS